MTTKQLTDQERAEAEHVLNTHPRNAILDAEIRKAEWDYHKTGDKKAYDLARKAAFAKYDAADPLM